VPLHPYALASRQIICLSHKPGRAVASYARVQAELHTSSHTVRCARLVQLWSKGWVDMIQKLFVLRGEGALGTFSYEIGALLF
jgi:hypothetical protein